MWRSGGGTSPPELRQPRQESRPRGNMSRCAVTRKDVPDKAGGKCKKRARVRVCVGMLTGIV